MSRKPCGRDFFVQVIGEWPPPPDAQEAPFSLSLNLRRRGVRPRPGEPLRQLGDPVILSCAHELLISFSRIVLSGGYIIRADAARALADSEPWPRWCTSAEQLAGLFGSLLSTRRVGLEDTGPDEGVYPVSLWYIPRGDPKAEVAVEAFRSLPSDRGLFRDVLALGVLRVAAFDAFCDLMADASDAGRVLDWMRAAVAESAHEGVEWHVGSGEYDV